MPSIRLMGFAAGALFFLSSTGNAQSLQAPGKAMPTGQAPSKVLPQPQGPGKGMPAAYGDAGSMGYYGGGYSGGTAGYPGGYDFGRPGYNPGGLGGPASGFGVRPGLGAGGLGRGADRPQVLRSPCGGTAAWTYGLTRGGVGGGHLIGAAAGEEIRTSTGAAGRHSGGDPALRSGRTDGGGWWASVPHRACGAEGARLNELTSEEVGRAFPRWKDSG